MLKMDWSKLDITGPALKGVWIFVSATWPWLLILLAIVLLKEFLAGRRERKYRNRRK
jgi:hypothetical protein